MLKFIGEVQLITGDELASIIGLTAGTSQFSTEPWLHFNDNGRDIYIAKKPFRHTVSWDQLNAIGAVYGSKTVTIDNKLYMVRLLRGTNSDPTTGGTYSGYNTTIHQGSEWNRYMYPIHSTTHVSGSNPNTSDMGTLASILMSSYTCTMLAVMVPIAGVKRYLVLVLRLASYVVTMVLLTAMALRRLLLMPTLGGVRFWN